MGHPPRIPVWLKPEQTVVYFATFCVRGRQRVLGNDAAFAAFQEAIAALKHWRVIAGILMPDHVHLLAAPDDRDLSPGNLSAPIKKKIRRQLDASWEWQPGCFDRLLRSDESAQEKWEYIRENPVRAGLVMRWNDWPYRFGFDDNSL